MLVNGPSQAPSYSHLTLSVEGYTSDIPWKLHSILHKAPSFSLYVLSLNDVGHTVVFHDNLRTDVCPHLRNLLHTLTLSYQWLSSAVTKSLATLLLLAAIRDTCVTTNTTSSMRSPPCSGLPPNLRFLACSKADGP